MALRDVRVTNGERSMEGKEMMFSSREMDRVRQAVARVTGVELPWPVEVSVDAGLCVTLHEEQASIAAEDLSALGRGYFLLSRAVREGQTELALWQSRRFASCGAMLDMSRGGVMRVEAVKRYIDQLAALGMNLLMLYTEDTYEVPEYPALGYLRGRYSQAELKEMDDYAASMGMELVPCIQTLGHMAQFLQWFENGALRDQADVLMIDEEKVYDLIRAEIRSMRACLRSRRIHIGMDEAHGVGLGNYYLKHGATNRFELLCRHLGRVVEICKEADFSPMMWSDMFFRIGSKTNEYYDENAEITEEITKLIPEVDMVYWDYYHQDEATYDRMLTLHEQMGRKVVFAGGIWTWSGFLPQVKRTVATMDPALKACAAHRVETVIATLWGDDGAETDYLMASGMLPIFSERCWQGEACTEEEIRLSGECLTCLPRAVLDAYGDFYPSTKDDRPGKRLIWSDLLYPIFDQTGDTWEGMLARTQSALETLRPYEDRLECHYAAELMRLLLMKAPLVRDLRAWYLAGEKEKLRRATEETIPALLEAYDRLMLVHRQLWQCNRKRFGWEVLSLRYGAVTGRLKDVQYELRRYLSGEQSTVEELEEEPLALHRIPFFMQNVTPSTCT